MKNNSLVPKKAVFVVAIICALLLAFTACEKKETLEKDDNKKNSSNKEKLKEENFKAELFFDSLKTFDATKIKEQCKGNFDQIIGTSEQELKALKELKLDMTFETTDIIDSEGKKIVSGLMNYKKAGEEEHGNSFELIFVNENGKWLVSAESTPEILATALYFYFSPIYVAESFLSAMQDYDTDKMATYVSEDFAAEFEASKAALNAQKDLGYSMNFKIISAEELSQKSPDDAEFYSIEARLTITIPANKEGEKPKVEESVAKIKLIKKGKHWLVNEIS